MRGWRIPDLFTRSVVVHPATGSLFMGERQQCQGNPGIPGVFSSSMPKTFDIRVSGLKNGVVIVEKRDSVGFSLEGRVNI
jgi:hypothetical protein